MRLFLCTITKFQIEIIETEPIIRSEIIIFKQKKNV